MPSHATKRGSHLALTLERLEALVRAANPEIGPDDAAFQRIGLSATQNPLEEIGRFLVGPRPRGRDRRRRRPKPLDLRIEVPVESMTEPGGPPSRARDPAGPVQGARGDPRLDLARHLPGAAEARARAHLDDRVRQQPPLRRADRAAAQRARHEGARGRATATSPRAVCSRSSSPAPTTARSRARSARRSRSC